MNIGILIQWLDEIHTCTTLSGGAVVIPRSKQNYVVGRHKTKDHPNELVRVKIKLHGFEA